MSEAQAQGQSMAETADTQVEAKPEAAESERTYTHSEYQTALKKVGSQEKKEGRTSAINKLLEKTGAESEDDLASGYLEYLEIKEAVTSDADRANERAEKLEAKAKAAEERYLNTLREFALKDALRGRGVPGDRLDDALALAKREHLEVDKEGNVSGIDEAVDELLEPRPWLLEGEQKTARVNAPQTNGITTSSSNGQTPEEQGAAWLVNLLGQ